MSDLPLEKSIITKYVSEDRTHYAAGVYLLDLCPAETAKLWDEVDAQTLELAAANARVTELKTQFEAHAWTISPAMAQATIDAQAKLIAALDKDVARLDWLEDNPTSIDFYLRDDPRGGPVRPTWLIQSADLSKARLFLREAIDAAMEAPE